jgi:glycosyltransferase involved in cell wall biosynthesis
LKESDDTLLPNVLQLIPSFDQGGSERQAVQLARLLRESGRCRLHVACLSREGVLRGEVERLGLGEIPEFPLKSFFGMSFARQLRRFAAFVRERGIDLVQTHDFYTNVFGMIGAGVARVPARVASKRETGGMRTATQRLVELQVYKLAHAVVVNAEAVKQQLLRDGVRASKIVVVHNGLDTARVRPPAAVGREEMLAALGLPRDRSLRFVTIVANLRHEVKDIPTFLRAASRVRASIPEAAFVVAGEGELTESMRALAAQLGLGDSVFFTGRCTRIAELLAVSDVCVLSSKAEGFSNSILEYMAAARPVVVTDVGGAREAVADGETGHLVRPGDDEAMAARVAELLRDRARARKMGEAGRDTIERKFSCEAQLEATLGLYQTLLARSTRAPLPKAVEDVHQGGA